MQRVNLLQFIVLGLLTALAGEFQINVLILDKGINAYLLALVLYTFLLILMYLLGKLLELKVSSKNIDVAYYLIGGFLGLAIEWFFIGNGPWAHNGAIQTGMFAWWGAVFLVPRIFATPLDSIVKSTRRQVAALLLIYSIVSTVIVILSPENLRPAIAGIMMAISYITINFQFIPYLVRNGSSKIFAKGLAWFLVIAGIINLVFWK